MRRKWRLGAHGPGGCYRNYTPRQKNMQRPTNLQPSHETITPVTLRPEAQWMQNEQTPKTRKKTKAKKKWEGGGDPHQPRKQREGGEARETLHYYIVECHATARYQSFEYNANTT